MHGAETGDGGDDPLSLADRAHSLVQADAAGGAALAERAVRIARRRHLPEAEVAALHALGFARHELGDPRAVATLRRAVRLGERHGLVHRTAMARRPLSMYLAFRGSIRAADRELDAACAALDAHELARSQVFRIALDVIAGREPTTLAESSTALELLRRRGDAIWEARLRRNRGFLLAERGDVDASEADLARARDLYRRLGAVEAALGTEVQLGRTALIRGDLPACLARLDAIRMTDVSPRKGAELELLRAQALAAGRLIPEALRAAGAAQSTIDRARIGDPELRLDVIRLTLLAGDCTAAYELARRAQRGFAAQRRELLQARAADLVLAAAIQAELVTPSCIAAGRRAASTFAAAGWATGAMRVRLSVARAAIELGQVGTARRELAACEPLLRRGPVGDRIEAWHVEALIRLKAGDPAGAQRAARRGLAVLEEHRAALGAADLRASVSSIGAELAQLGLRIALTDSRPGPTLRWAEALRASSLRLTPVTPPSNPELRGALTELRRLSAELARADESGRSTSTLLARQARVETQIRRLSRHLRGESRPSRARPSQAQLTDALGPRALVEFLEVDGELTALTLAGGRLRRHALGPIDGVADPLEWLRFGLARLANLRHDAPQRQPLTAGAQASAAALERLLLAPLEAAIGERALVLVPTGTLHTLPWAMLPALRGRPLSVAPSAAVWWALSSAPRARRRRPRVVLVAGPRLRHAAAEVRRIAAVHDDASSLTGAAATVAATARALNGATLAHLACHGQVRADSPLFSSLELADGRLSAYELQRLRRAPELIVLSACDLAVSDTRPGDELLGFAGALLDMGTRTIIASLVPVADAAARRVMPALHRGLAAGLSPARALAQAQSGLARGDTPLAGFACLGAG